MQRALRGLCNYVSYAIISGNFSPENYITQMAQSLAPTLSSFKIKTVEGPDDFASMEEVVHRRYKRLSDEGQSLPQLIVIDGGKGQLSSSKDALDSLGLAFIPVIGIAKKMEEVFKPNISEPQNISKTSPGLMLLKRVRDESHRFAIQFHRQIREKGMLQ